MDSPFGSKQAPVGLSVKLCGDHRVHTFSCDRDVTARWDGDSLVLEIDLNGWQAEDLYWFLVETIPKLRDDRR